MKACPICQLKSATVSNAAGDRRLIDCWRCGKYIITNDLIDDLDSIFSSSHYKRMLASYVIRQSTRFNPRMLLNYERLDQILKQSVFPSVARQVELVIEHIGENVKFPGMSFYVSLESLGGFIGAFNEEATKYFLDAAENQGLVEYDNSDRLSLKNRPTLTVRGWEEYSRLLSGKTNSRTAFMAMKFGDTKLDAMLNNCFRPAVMQSGFVLRRLDDQPQAGLIDIRLRQEIKSAKFMIADLTHANLGAYWEAGFAEGLGKQVIYTCEKEHFEQAKTHFDVNHHLTIMWDENNLIKTAADLKAAIRFTFPDAIQNDENLPSS